MTEIQAQPAGHPASCVSGPIRLTARRPPAARAPADLTASRRRLALIAIAPLVGLACATLIQSYSWNQTAHYDLIQAFDNDATNIDAYQSNTGDKVRYHGHFYSARAPGLALFVLPFYDTLNLVDAKGWSEAHVAPPNRPGDEFIYLLGLWGNVIPGLLLVLLVYAVAERFEPGYGAAAAIVLGLGTMVLPLSTLMFSHVFTALLGFAAFWLMMREREGPPSFWRCCARRARRRLRDRLGVPAGLRRGRARAVPALAARLA